jgi:hypothetical protein
MCLCYDFYRRYLGKLLLQCDTMADAMSSCLLAVSQYQGSSDRPGAPKFGLKIRKSGDRKDLMSGPTGGFGGLGAGASGLAEAPEPTSGPARRFSLCQRVISGRESLFTAARQT